MAHMNRFSIGSSPDGEMKADADDDGRRPRRVDSSDPLKASVSTRLMRMTDNLHAVADAMKAANHTMHRLDERCDAFAFYDRLRPWLAGHPEGGVCYQGVFSGEIPRVEKYSGASGAQSALLPSIDAFLGITYGSSGTNTAGVSVEARTGMGKFLSLLQSYRWHMPPQHRRFLRENVQAKRNVRDLISHLEECRLRESLPVGVSDVKALKKAYNRCIHNMIHFRQKHNDSVAKYIKSMAEKREAAQRVATTAASPMVRAGVSQRAATDAEEKALSHLPKLTLSSNVDGQRRENDLGTSSSKAGSFSSESTPTKVVLGKGTGGSDYTSFLQKFLTDTRRCLYDVSLK